MTSNTPKYVIPFPDLTDTVASLATTIGNLSARVDLLLGESGNFTASPAANTTFSQAVTLSRTYPGNGSSGTPAGLVLVQLQATQTAATGFSWWITAWTGTASTVTGFTINVQFTAAQSSRVFNWRFVPAL